MSTSIEAVPALPALDLVRPHLARLEGRSILRQQAVSKKDAVGELAVIDRRIRSHIMGLQTQRIQAIRIASLQLHSSFAFEACTAAVALLDLAPDVVLEKSGALRLRPEVATLLFKLYPLGSHRLQATAKPDVQVDAEGDRMAPGSEKLRFATYAVRSQRDNGVQTTSEVPSLSAPNLLAIPFHQAESKDTADAKSDTSASSESVDGPPITHRPPTNVPASRQTLAVLALSSTPALPFGAATPLAPSPLVAEPSPQDQVVGTSPMESIMSVNKRFLGGVSPETDAPASTEYGRVPSPKPAAQTAILVATPRIDALPFSKRQSWQTAELLTQPSSPTSSPPTPTPTDCRDQRTMALPVGMPRTDAGLPFVMARPAPLSSPRESSLPSQVPLTLQQHAALCAELAVCSATGSGNVGSLPPDEVGQARP